MHHDKLGFLYYANSTLYFWEKWFDTRKNLICHRKLILLSGSQQWTYQQAIHIVKSASAKSLWIGDSTTFTVRGIPVKQYKKLLGQECNIGIYDAQKGVSPSALLALSGTINHSGVLILCCPSWHTWQFESSLTQKNLISHGFTLTESHFINRWKQLIENDPGIERYCESDTPCYAPSNEVSTLTCGSLPSGFASQDQYASFIVITKEQAHQSVAITAKRGRGKSALLGLLADHYLRQGRKVAVCTSLKENSNTLFKHTTNNKPVLWYAPDAPELTQPLDLLIVDEVANLPINETLRILANCKQFIIATTTDGYEGTGQGFRTKLLPKLLTLYPCLKPVEMEAPIRYCENDKLEEHLQQIFFLNTDIPQQRPVPTAFDKLNVKIVRRKADICNQQLNQWFGLLCIAHYQTTPEDVVRMLDSPDNFFITLSDNNNLLAVAVVIEEGGRKLAELSPDIASGCRRLKGHQMAQKLSLLLSEPTVATSRIWRVNRIAVQPNMQSNSLGSYFLQYIEASARHEQVDLLGASFGCNKRTANFWMNNQFTPIHLGSTADKSTGEKAVFVCKLISNTLPFNQSQLNSLFQAENKQALLHEYHYLCPSLQTLNTSQLNYINTVNQRRILDYINDSRSYLHMGTAISDWLTQHRLRLADLTKIGPQFDFDLELLNRKWIQAGSDQALQSTFNIKGRKKLYSELKRSFANIYWKLAE